MQGNDLINSDPLLDAIDLDLVNDDLATHTVSGQSDCIIHGNSVSVRDCLLLLEIVFLLDLTIAVVSEQPARQCSDSAAN